MLAAILGNKNYTIVFQEEERDGKGDSILVDGVPLPEFLEKNTTNMTTFLKDQFVLITRMFDNRVKAFIKTILMTGDISH